MAFFIVAAAKTSNPPYDITVFVRLNSGEFPVEKTSGL
jgi:hypothetical protein